MADGDTTYTITGESMVEEAGEWDDDPDEITGGGAGMQEDDENDDEEEGGQTMAESTEYKVQLVQSENIPAPDDLIAGDDYHAQEIKIATSGEYTRGELLMSSGTNFVAATAAGIASAEVCILCDDVTIQQDSYIETTGYFKGTFNGKAIVLPYETDSDDHSTLIEAVRPTLRKQSIYIV